MRLAAPTPKDEAAVMDFRHEIMQSGEQLLGAGGLENYDRYSDWLHQVYKNQNEQTVHPDLPPSSMLLYWHHDILAGIVEIRHRLTEFQFNYSGHIGFTIRHFLRGQGLGTRLLSLALEECRQLGLNRVLLTCSHGDAVSRAAIESNGGILENKIAYEGDVRCRYWVYMEPAACRPLHESELTRELFSAFDRYQQVTYCRRRIGVSWRMVHCPFVDDWTEEQFQHQIQNLQTLLRSGGVVYGAFVEGTLKGFAAVEGKPLGPHDLYRDLASLHVSADCRGQGLGRMLFDHAADWARRDGAQKLYISAHSAMETQAFYEAMGCVDTQWPSPEHVALEPFDCQLEYSL